jgi:CSLREA domain-containing protein
MTLRSHCAVLSCVLLGSFAVPPARGAVFLVDDTDDVVDASLGDGLCATSSGACTLRAAIQEANAFAGDDTVMLPAGTFTISLPFMDDFRDADGSFYLSSTVDLVGVGADLTILDGGMLDRVLQVAFDGLATVSDLTIQNGSRAGILTNSGGNLTLLRVTVQDNQGLAFADPGGIKVEGATLSLIESTVQSNTADFATGGILFTGDTLSAVDTVIRDNFGVGGIVSGGMICNFGTARFERVAFIGNQGLAGAGLLVMAGCDVTLTNVTLSGNTLLDRTGGTVENVGGVVTLANVTVTESSGFGLTGAMTLRNTIVAGNGNFDFQQCDTSSVRTSLGHNIDEGTSCGFDQETDLSDTDPRLGPLDEEGDSPAHSPVAPSLAIDGISLEDCLDSGGMALLTDQRGVERPQGSACDIGAVEVVPEPATVALQLTALVSLTALAFIRTAAHRRG